MELVYLKSFLNDIKKIKDTKVKAKLKEFIFEAKSSGSLGQLSNIKKLKGYSTAYRVRIGKYRLGFYKENDKAIELARFVSRSEIYKLFPKKGN